jgi:hypothetical protein
MEDKKEFRMEQIAAIRALLEERAQMKSRIAFLNHRLQEGFEQNSVLTGSQESEQDLIQVGSQESMRSWYEEVIASETEYDEGLLNKNLRELEFLLDKREKLQRQIENEQSYIINRLQRRMFQLFETGRTNRLKSWSLFDELGTSLFMLRPNKAQEDEFRIVLREVKSLSEQRYRMQMELLDVSQQVNRLNLSCFNLTAKFHDREVDKRVLAWRRIRATTREIG